MTNLVKVLGLLLLPVALIVFIAAALSGRAGKGTKGFFVQEYDEQNIYG